MATDDRNLFGSEFKRRCRMIRTSPFRFGDETGKSC